MIDNKKNTEKNINQENKTDTTGHKWDGITEYDIGAPRWWLIVWFICIIWAIIYWFFYPTWPTKEGNSKGILNWTQQSQLNKSQNKIDEIRKEYLDQIAKSSFEEIKKNPELLDFALNGGKAAFKENCAACHGQGAQGYKGFPNLNDDDWLWGGKVEDIYQTLLYGIRSSHDKTRYSQMPSFGSAKILTKEQINNLIDYVLSFSAKESQEKSQSIAEGEKLFAANCVACHGNNGKGKREVGAPNLTDQIWLYGNSQEELYQTIYYARAGVMPYWINRLDDATIKQLSLYVHSLGGGE
jgi:cytochrome c oxidase cbb3-type subunit 3